MSTGSSSLFGVIWTRLPGAAGWAWEIEVRDRVGAAQALHTIRSEAVHPTKDAALADAQWVAMRYDIALIEESP